MAIVRVFEAIARLRHFRGRTRILRALHRFAGESPIRSTYGPLIYNVPSDATNFYYTSGTDDRNYADVHSHVASLAQGACFLDIGANAGLFSIIAGQAVGPNGVVIAFEPNLHVFSALTRNLRLNGLDNVIPLNVALGERSTKVRFKVDAVGHTGVGHVAAGGNMVVWQASPADLKQFLLPLIGDRRVTVKVDVEGAEAIVIASIAPVVDDLNIDKWVVEIDRRHLERFNSTPEQLYEAMRHLGFVGELGVETGGHYNEVFTRAETLQ